MLKNIIDLTSQSNDGDNKQDGNGLMVVSFMFCGCLFLLFLLLFLIAFGVLSANQVLGSIDVKHILSSISTGNIAILTFFISILLYSLGFMNYCLSYIFISIPSYFAIGKIRGKNKAYHFKSDVIIKDLNNTLERNLDSNKENFLLFENELMEKSNNLGLLYLYLRSKNNKISSEMKFLFNQVMFARSSLFGLLLACVLSSAIWLHSESYSFVVIVWCLSTLCITILISICIYIQTIKFWDRALYNSFYINKLNNIEYTQNTEQENNEASAF